jgi:hypothetical protein
VIAAISIATMDTLSHHFSTSIFKNEDKQFWDPSISWTNKYNILTHVDGTKYYVHKKLFKKDIPIPLTKGKKTFNVNTFEPLSDAWHRLKSLGIISFIVAISLNDSNQSFSSSIITTILLGAVFNVTFNLFYNKLLLSKTKK